MEKATTITNGSDINCHNIVTVIDRIIAKSEIMLRGGSVKMVEEDVNNLKRDAYFIYEVFRTGHSVDFSEDDKRSLLELSIKLHNKIRNLPNTLIETRAILKAACAWAFAALSEKHDKVSVIVIKLLRKAGEELSHMKILDKALDCFIVATNLWKTVQNAQYIDQLPPLEVQDLKLSIFSCHLQVLKLLSAENCNASEIKEHLQSAMSLLPYVSIKNRLNLAELLADIASQLSVRKQFHSAAINLFDKCIDILDSKELQRENIASHEAEVKLKHVNTVKMRCYLSMSYMFLLNEDRSRAWAALGCADNLQSSTDLNLSHSICYAKIVLFIKEEQLDKAEEQIKVLMKLPSSPFKTQLSAINQFFNNIPESFPDIPGKITELFKLLANRQLSAEETALLRISHLQTNLRVLINKPDDGLLEERARQTMVRLFSAVSQGELTISEQDCENIGNLVKEQIKVFRAKDAWSQVRLWCDIYLPFLDTSHTNIHRYISCAILKVESLIKLRQYAEALDTAFRAITKQVTNQTILIYFQTMLLVDDIDEEEIVKRLQNQQEKYQGEFTASNQHFLEDKYGQVMLCLSYVNSRHADNISLVRRSLVTVYAIQYLLKMFLEEELWKRMDAASISMPILHLAKAYFGQYIAVILERFPDSVSKNEFTPSATDQDLSINFSHSVLFNSMRDNEQKVISFRNHIVDFTNLLISLLEKMQTLPRETLYQIIGSNNDYSELSEILATTGYFLSMSARQNQTDSVKKAFLLAGADILSSTGKFYHFAPLFMDVPYKQHEARCYITAASALLDAASMIAPIRADFEDFITGNEKLGGLHDKKTTTEEHDFDALHIRVRDLTKQSESLLFDQLEYDDPIDRKLFSLAVVMEISSLCRAGKINTSESEVQRLLPYLSMLDMEDMKNCIDLFAMSQNVSTEAFRSLLSIAENMCLETIPVHKATGYVFGKELQLSSSRAIALKKVEQFEKILDNPTNAMVLSTEDIEFITANAHNAAMSLHELGQGTLAKRFNSLAISMLPHISKEREGDWLNRMKSLEKAIIAQEEELSTVIVDNGPIDLMAAVSDNSNSPDQNSRKRQRTVDIERPKTPDKIGPLRVEDFSSTK